MNFHEARYTASYGTSAQLPPSRRAEVAFAGRSNVGKSSLLNKLMYRKGLAKVSSKPGKTATVNFYSIGADSMDLVDLPGYGYAQVSQSELDRWADLIEGYFNDDREIALVVALIDIRHDPSALDRDMVSFLQDAGIPFAVALTKADKLSNQKAMSQRKRIAKSLGITPVPWRNMFAGEGIDASDHQPGVPVIATSTTTGKGIDELRELISAAACRQPHVALQRRRDAGCIPT